MIPNGEAIRSLRQSRGWLLKPFADEVGINPSFLSKIERNLCGAKPEVIKKMAETLGVPVGAIVSSVIVSEALTIRPKRPGQAA